MNTSVNDSRTSTMLSSRGALNTPTLLLECAAAQSKTAKKIFLLHEAENVWTALGKVLRAQLIQNIPVQIPKIGSLWFDMKLLVTDGPLKYYQRVPKFGFHHTFMSTYGVDDIHVPMENLKISFERLPMDQIATVSGVGAQTASLVLQEMFLYVGEGLFNGKVLNLEFPGLMTILMKREKAIVTFDETLLADLFTIDSRKWPLAVKEMALIAREAQVLSARPSSAASSRPRSASSSRPTTQPKPLEPRPAFVSSAQAGKLFCDIQNLPPRQLSAKLPSPKGPRSASRRQPLKAKPQVSRASEEEEESIYEVLSPERHNHQQYTGDDEVFVVDGTNYMCDEDRDDAHVERYDAPPIPKEEVEEYYDDVPSRPQSSAPVTAPPSRSVGHRASSVRALLCGEYLEEAEAPHRIGRKRFGGDPQKDHLGYLFNSKKTY